MDELKHKIKQKVHKAKLHISTHRPTQIALYVAVLIFLVVIVTLLVTTTVNQQKAFIKYHVKSCYNKNNVEGNLTQDIVFATKGENIVVASYTFVQKCYDGIEVDHSRNDNNINIYVMPENMKEDCLCETNVQAEIGPLKEKVYIVNIFKKTEGVEYLIKTETITMK